MVLTSETKPPPTHSPRQIAQSEKKRKKENFLPSFPVSQNKITSMNEIDKHTKSTHGVHQPS